MGVYSHNVIYIAMMYRRKQPLGREKSVRLFPPTVAEIAGVKRQEDRLSFRCVNQCRYANQFLIIKPRAMAACSRLVLTACTRKSGSYHRSFPLTLVGCACVRALMEGFARRFDSCRRLKAEACVHRGNVRRLKTT